MSSEQIRLMYDTVNSDFKEIGIVLNFTKPVKYEKLTRSIAGFIKSNDGRRNLGDVEILVQGSSENEKPTYFVRNIDGALKTAVQKENTGTIIEDTSSNPQTCQGIEISSRSDLKQFVGIVRRLYEPQSQTSKSIPTGQ